MLRLLLLFLLFTSIVNAETVSISSVANALVNYDKFGSVTGATLSQGGLYIQSNDSSYYGPFPSIRSWLKFSLSEVPDNSIINTAFLEITLGWDHSVRSGFEIYKSSFDSWGGNTGIQFPNGNDGVISYKRTYFYHFGATSTDYYYEPFKTYKLELNPNNINWAGELQDNYLSIQIKPEGMEGREYDVTNYFTFYDPKLTLTYSVPEPSALSLLAVGLGGLAMMRRRRS